MCGRLSRRPQAACGRRPRRRVGPDVGHPAGVCDGRLCAPGPASPVGRCRGSCRGPRAAPHLRRRPHHVAARPA
eukprot:2074210-Lingulodinium_polyedra.AAC.1